MSPSGLSDKKKNMKKGDWYKHLFGRVDKAIAEEYYYEVAFICYGIIDDRLTSIMIKLGKTPGIMSIRSKINWILKQRDVRSEKAFLVSNWNPGMGSTGKYLKNGIFKEIIAWGELYRNPMQHTLGDPRHYKATIGNFHTDNTKDLAIEGKRIAREFSAAVMRWKK